MAILVLENHPKGWGGGTPYSLLYMEVLPKRGAFFKLAVTVVILVYERVTKLAAKWKR